MTTGEVKQEELAENEKLSSVIISRYQLQRNQDLGKCFPKSLATKKFCDTLVTYRQM
jgi:hypothetical protein